MAGRSLVRWGRRARLLLRDSSGLSVLGLTSRQVDRIRAQVLPRLRQGLVSLVNVLGPDMVVLGGV